MAHVTGTFLLDAQAAALNNAGDVAYEEDNVTGVKAIHTKNNGVYPYVSSQAYRYWLRTTLENKIPEWRAAPIVRAAKVAYTYADPLQYWDDDLFGYMRATKRETAKARDAREAAGEPIIEGEPMGGTISRTTALVIGTLVSIAPCTPTRDFGVMSRQKDGDPVPYSHEFYRTTLAGMFALDLASCGTFTYNDRSGERNLDEPRLKQAVEIAGIEHLETEKKIRLPMSMRVERIQALFTAWSLLEGGAKQGLHYTPVAPPWAIFAVTKGGNNIFQYVIKADRQGLPTLNLDALQEALTINADQLLSPIQIGWTRGYMDEERAKLESFVNESSGAHTILISHPRTAFSMFVQSLNDTEQAAQWLR